jgi:hypothetical protein
MINFKDLGKLLTWSVSRHYSNICLQGLWEITKHLFQLIQSPDEDSKVKSKRKKKDKVVPVLILLSSMP